MWLKLKCESIRTWMALSGGWEKNKKGRTRETKCTGRLFKIQWLLQYGLIGIAVVTLSGWTVVMFIVGMAGGQWGVLHQIISIHPCPVALRAGYNYSQLPSSPEDCHLLKEREYKRWGGHAVLTGRQQPMVSDNWRAHPKLSSCGLRVGSTHWYN